MSALVDEIANEYFSSMSSLASKFLQDCDAVRNAYGTDWDELDIDRQEQLINDYIMRPEITEQYSSREGGDLPNCFPVLKINSGEKVIVDFEHEDGWTWTDEHSAPFSWRSRSQQDLTLADLMEATTDTARGRGVSSALNSVTTDDDRNEVQRMFEKFGIKVDSDSLEEKSDRSSVLERISETYPDPVFNFKHQSDIVDDSAFSAALEDDEEGDINNINKSENIANIDSLEESVTELISDKPLAKLSSDRTRNKSDVSEEIESVEKETSGNGGIFLEIPGESTTDDLALDNSDDGGEPWTPSRDNGTHEVIKDDKHLSEVITTQPQSANCESVSSKNLQQDASDDESTVTKSGFDFLDNW